MGRAALGLGVRELSEAAKVSTNTVTRFERGEPLKAKTIDVIREVLETAGIEFIAENGGGPGVRLKNAGKREGDYSEPKGPATDVVKQMDEAIDKDRKKLKRP